MGLVYEMDISYTAGQNLNRSRATIVFAVPRGPRGADELLKAWKRHNKDHDRLAGRLYRDPVCEGYRFLGVEGQV